MSGHELPARRAAQDLEAPADAYAGAFLAGYASARTQAAYRRDLADWFAFLAAYDVEPLAARRAHVDLYARSLEQAQRSPATIARRLSTLAGFYRYLCAEGALDASPVAHVRRPRVADESPTLGPDRDELGRFLDAAEHAGPRDHALACLLGLLGLRVSEACTVRAEDLAAERGHRTLTVTRKGARRATVPLPPRAAGAIDAALEGRTEGPILRDGAGEQLDRHDAARIVRRLARAAGIDKRLSPHSLRHGFVTVALEAGAPLHVVQDAAGHADPRTTRRYDRARRALDGHAAYTLAAFVAGGSA